MTLRIIYETISVGMSADFLLPLAVVHRGISSQTPWVTLPSDSMDLGHKIWDSCGSGEPGMYVVALMAGLTGRIAGALLLGI